MDTRKLIRLGGIGALALAGLGAAWFWPGPTPAGGAPAAVNAATASVADGTTGSAGVTLHVSGAVAAPGLVEVPVGSRVADAIAAAGGVLPGADVAALNLAAPVRDGEQVRIPEGSNAASGGGGPPDDGLVHINVADSVALELLPGVGPVLAARIVAHREQHGPFATVEDLLDVPGIGEGRLASMRDVVAIP